MFSASSAPSSTASRSSAVALLILAHQTIRHRSVNAGMPALEPAPGFPTG